jgi:ubiquinol-cytochrome c reductase cytochrome c1 subunit
MMMKKLLLSLLAALAFGVSSLSHAAGGGIAWDKFPTEKMNDTAALQHGAKLFVNYCLNCHSAAYMRYNRLADIGLTPEQIRASMMFTGDKIGEQMKAAIDPKQAKEWFGGTPPDLTVIARSRSAAGQGSGADYLYTFLRTFYRDDSKATGWNNLAFPSVGMPHVLWELQGVRSATYADEKDPHDATKTVHVLKGFEQASPGKLSALDYDNTVADLVAFLQWMGEPQQGLRVRLGVWVMMFMALVTLIAWRLNAAYWKDIK